MKKGIYISTAIAYPNNRMHVGYAWEVMGADVLARYHRMKGRPVFFSTGLDEHSQNVEKAARAAGVDPHEYCNQMAQDIQGVMDQMGISYDRFIRTSDPDHKRVCQQFMERAYKADDIYLKAYEGMYCDSCETFYTEKDLVNDGNEVAGSGSVATLCPVHKKPTQKIQEENYFFRLSKYEKEILELLEPGKGFLVPEHRASEIREFVKQGLKDFSVSRNSFTFGIPVPWDPRHMIYVWYDALMNYVSAVRYGEDSEFFKTFWPCDVHIVGKDITRFHCVYWPAMLLSTHRDGGEPIALPQRVWAHGFLQYQGEKMSKTRGNIVTPDGVMADYGATALRWYLLSTNSFAQDGHYSDQDLIHACNADLGNNIGNLVNRVVSMARKYIGPQVRVAFPESPLLARYEQHLGKSAHKLSETLQEMGFHQYSRALVEFSQSLNKYIDEVKPWSLAKDLVGNGAYLERCLGELLEGIRVLAIGLTPVVPLYAAEILRQLGMDSQVTWEDINFRLECHFQLTEPKPIFQRIETLSKT